MKLKSKFLSGFLSLGLVASSLFISNADSQQLEVHYINVGQGDCTYIELPDGSDILVDAGKAGQGKTVVNYLVNQEKNLDIEYLLATHPDADHIGGMQEVFKSLNVKNFYYPYDSESDTQTWGKVLDLASAEGCKISDSNPGTVIEGGGATMKFVHPSKDYSDTNEDSIVTFLEYKDAEFLFTGDMESATEKDMIEQNLVVDTDFMSIPHHGSKTSSTQAFLDKAKPEYAVVSVGKNGYGHPVQEVLDRYASIGTQVFRTDEVGNIVIKSDGNTATINRNSVNIGGTQTDDVTGHWAESIIRNFVSNGYMNGYPEGDFKPNNSITRAEFVSIATKYFNLTTTSNATFADSRGHWAENAIDIAVTNGLTSGMSETEFAPNSPITREQAATMISKFKKLSDSDHNKINQFTDKDQISDWAKDFLEGVVENGYMGGYPEGNFNPKGNLTRAEAAVTLSKVK